MKIGEKFNTGAADAEKIKLKMSGLVTGGIWKKLTRFHRDLAGTLLPYRNISLKKYGCVEHVFRRQRR